MNSDFRMGFWVGTVVQPAMKRIIGNVNRSASLRAGADLWEHRTSNIEHRTSNERPQNGRARQVLCVRGVL
jgi:hypothetical protein